MADTTIADGPKDRPGQKAASGIGGWFQKNKTLAIAIGIVVLVIIFYFFYHNSQASGAANTSGSAGASGGSTISPADLAGLLSSIPQGPAGATGATGATGAQGPAGKQGKPGKNGSPPPKRHKRKTGPPAKHTHVATQHVTMPVNNTHKQARPPVHPTSQKPAVARPIARRG